MFKVFTGKITAFGLIIIIVISLIENVSAAEVEQTELSQSLSYNSYYDYIKQYENMTRVYDGITVLAENAFPDMESSLIDGKQAVILDEDDVVNCEITIEQNGLYNFGITYYPIEGDEIDVEIGIKIDGNLPFSELGSNTLFREWYDSEKPGERKDINGNDLLPKQIEKREWIKSWLFDFGGYATEPYYIYLEKGKHTITFEVLRQSLGIYSFELEAKNEIQEYSEKSNEYASESLKDVELEEPIILEAEETYLKSSASLVAKTDYSSPYTSPYSPSKIRLNTIGGSSYSKTGQWIEWKTSVQETGLYRISFRCRQNFLSGAYVSRKLYVNGEIPYKELENIKFQYDSEWQIVTVETPILLKSGENILRLEVTVGELSSIIDEINTAVQELNYAYRQIIIVTGVNPDPYRDYELEVYAPEALEIFSENEKRIAKCNDELIELTGKRGSANGILQTMTALLKKLNTKIYDIQNNLTLLKDDIASLSTWLADIRSQSLEIDKIYIHSKDTDLGEANAGIFAKLKHEFLSFISTFTEDYASIGVMNDNNEKIEVWIATGRDQANILNNLITEYFSPTYNIAVDLKLVQGQLLAATASGIGPDVALQMGQSEPVNYALRNAVIDLSKFDDFSEVASRFNDSALVPFELNNGVYGLPETQTFPMMFIRTDVFEELKLEIPKTWDDFLGVVGKLQKKNMSGGIPAPTNDDISTFAMLLYQNGGSFYSEDGSQSELGTDESIEAFKQLTLFFTDYSIPTQYNALNRFRSGEMPILINDYTLYNQIAVGAPEIRGLWEMYEVPGIEESDGSINNLVSFSGTACMILSSSKNSQNSWKFINWWTSAEAQQNFGQNIELLLGSSARYCSANIEAFEKLPWSKDEYNVLSSQRKSVRGIPQVAGGYFTPRHINNAFRKVINQNLDARETLLSYVANINDEIRYKRNELGMQ